MRFIVREQGYEKPIASGQFRYEEDGVPTGAVESWRLTTAVSGYQILRVDLDARNASSGDSYIFHLVQQDDGTPERLGYRYWSTGLMIEGTVLFEGDQVSCRRNVNGRTLEEVIPVCDGFWFPSTIGLGIASKLSNKADLTTATLNNQPNQEETLALMEKSVSQTSDDDQSELTLNGKTYTVTPTTFSWQSSTRTVWLDINKNWPLKMTREDGLTAVETRYIWYGT
ncbi:MAG: hypothetical protein AAF490_08620 [Chloroflexota bacterium]